MRRPACATVGAQPGTGRLILTQQRRLELIGQIYDCVLEPQNWPDVLTGMMRDFRWYNLTLTANSLRGTVPGQLFVMLNVPDEYVPIIRKYESEVIELWGGVEVVMNAPLEEPLRHTDVTTPEICARNGYYQNFVVPQGIIDSVAVPLARDATMIASISGGRHRDQGPFLEAEFDELRVLAPHLRRAVLIGGLFQEEASRAATFAAALEESLAGIILVDAGGRVVHANRSGDEMLRAGDPAASQLGALVLKTEIVPGAFAHALAAASSGDAGIGRSGIGIPTRRQDGTPTIIHVLPLADREVRRGLTLSATAAVFIAPAADAAQLPADAVRLLFGLTPAEERVFELAAEGLSAPDIAERLTVAVSTVKTHLIHIFAKTGVPGQVELVRLSERLSRGA